MVSNPLIGPAICWGKRGIGVRGPLKFPIINEFCFFLGGLFLCFFGFLMVWSVSSRFFPLFCFFFFRRLVYPGNPKTFKKIGFSPSRLFFVK